MSDVQVVTGLIRHYSHSKSECLYIKRIHRPNCPQNTLGTLQYRCLFASKAEPSRLSNFDLEFANGSSHPDRRIMIFAHKGAFRCVWLPLTSMDPVLSGRTCRILRMNFSETSVICGRISFFPIWCGSPRSKTPRRLQLSVFY